MEHDDKLAHDAEFARWYTTHHDRIRALCARILRDPNAAEDIAQETLLRAWERREQMREEDLGAWLSVVARNLCLSSLRKDGRMFVTDEVPDRPDAGADPAIEVGRRESRRNVRRALAKLGPRSRRVIDLREVREADYEEIGSELGLSAEGARAIAFRARKVMREHLTAVGEGFSGILIGIRVRMRSLFRYTAPGVEGGWIASALQAGLSLTLVVALGNGGTSDHGLDTAFATTALRPAVAAVPEISPRHSSDGVDVTRTAVGATAAKPGQDGRVSVNREGDVVVAVGRPQKKTGVEISREPSPYWPYPWDRQITFWAVDTGIATACSVADDACDRWLPEEP